MTREAAMSALRNVSPPPDEQPHAGDGAVAHNQILKERMLDDVDERIGPHHGGHIQFDHLAGGVSPRRARHGPANARLRGHAACGLASRSKCTPAAANCRTRSAPSRVEYLHGTGSHRPCPAAIVSAACSFGSSSAKTAAAMPPLRMVGVDSTRSAFGDQRHVLAGIGYRQRRGKARDARADYDDFSVAHCAASSIKS